MIQKFIELSKKAIQKHDVQALFRAFYPELGFLLTPGQEEIAKSILFPDHNKIIINAYTQYGKSNVASFAICIRLAIYRTNVMIIAPTSDQTSIIRNYFSEAIRESPILRSIVQISETRDIEHFNKESSKKKQTFSNGSSYEIKTAYGEGNVLMVFNGDVVISDEDSLISDTAQAKIGRMFTSKDENLSLWIKLCNPWSIDSHSYRCWTSEDWKRVHIDWRQGVKEGRTTEQFIESMRRDLTEIEFEVLYESNFPEQPTDALYNLAKINQLATNDINISGEVSEILGTMSETKEKSPATHDEWKKKLKDYEFRVSADPAGKGIDSTVIFAGYKRGNEYELTEAYSENKSEPLPVARKIVDMALSRPHDDIFTRIIIDPYGIGQGVVNAVKELISGYSNMKVVEAGFGERAERYKFFYNRKAEEYFHNSKIVGENRIKTPKIYEKLRSQLISIDWKRSQATKEKVIIKDPAKSPDWADCFVYFTWDAKEMQAKKPFLIDAI